MCDLLALGSPSIRNKKASGKAADFNVALKKKIEAEDFDFRGVWFPDKVSFKGFKVGKDVYERFKFGKEAKFEEAVFGEEAYFDHIIFEVKASFINAVFFKGANFSFTIFKKEAEFVNAHFFEKVDFSGTRFSECAFFSTAQFSLSVSFLGANFTGHANFISSKFIEAADFSSATFSNEVYFVEATFNKGVDFQKVVFSADADFRSAAFKGNVRFSSRNNRQVFGEQSSLDLQHVTIDNPSQVSFHTATLRPHWFVNVDPSKFVFTAVEWKSISLDEEIECLSKSKNIIMSAHKLLVKTCRELAINAEEDHLYEQAGRFRYMSMEALRKNKWRGWKCWKTDWLHMLYYAVSGYGERILRAFGVLVGIMIIFAWLYTLPGFKHKVPEQVSSTGTVIAGAYEVVAPISFQDSLLYSLRVMTLQKPDPSPFTRTANVLVTLETILGPIQAALLALAIRRKFMR